MEAAFDALAYFERLKEAGVPEAQAKVQADALGEFSREQNAKNLRELATKGDLRESELRLQKEIREVEARLELELKNVELRLLKWQWGIALALGAIMAKGFGWLGF